MELREISPKKIETAAARTLGLNDHSAPLLSTEGVAASLRRAAGFLCPTSPALIVRTVHRAYAGLPGYTETSREKLNTVFRALLGSGDLLSLSSAEGVQSRIHLGPPLFVRNLSHGLLLTGVRPDGLPLIEDDMTNSISIEGHMRWIRPPIMKDMFDTLAHMGFMDVSLERWLKAPRKMAPEALVQEHENRLLATRSVDELAGMTLLDTATPVTYYRGRWRKPKADDRGTFVARRPRAFGADLWCFAYFGLDRRVHVIDLPLARSVVPPMDAAWRLQAAMDALAGKPQVLRVRAVTASQHVNVDFFSPLPGWAQRRLDISGTLSASARGALFSYQLLHNEAEEAVQFLEDQLWMRVVSTGEEGRLVP